MRAVDIVGMQNRFHVALYVWDFFYVANVPARGDEKVWKVVENATCRIQESLPFTEENMPADERLRDARRVRNSARAALRNIKLLSTHTPRWVIEGLIELEAYADALITTLIEPARQLVVD